MKITGFALVLLGALILNGCASFSQSTKLPVQLGMTRDDLRTFFGQPLRVVPVAGGGEDWYYHFVDWKSQPTGSSGTSDDFGQKTSYASVGLQFSRNVVERPIHVSPDDEVIPPLPEGKIVKNK